MKKNLLALFFLSFTSLLHAQKAVVLVYPFSNDGTAEYAWLSAGITNTVVSDLDAVAGVLVVTEEERRKAIREIEFAVSDAAAGDTAVRVGRMTGADLIFSGNYTVVAEKIRVVAKLIRVETGRIEKTVKVDGALDDIFSVQDRIVIGLLNEAGKITLPDREQVRLTKAEIRTMGEGPRPGFTAFEHFSRGLELLDRDPARALEYFELAVSLEPAYREALVMAGFVAGIKLNRFSDALDYLFKAAALFKGEELESNAFAALLETMGSVYLARGEDDKALQFYMMARGKKEALGLESTYPFALLMMNVGNAHSHQGNVNEAIDYNTKALLIMQKLDRTNTVEYAGLMTNIGNDVMKLGHLDKAEIFLNASVEIRRNLGLENALEQAVTYSFLATIAHVREQWDDALTRYAKAEQILTGLGLTRHMRFANVMYGLGDLYERKGDAGKAGGYFKRAYDIFVDIGYEGPEKERALKRAEKYGS